MDRAQARIEALGRHISAAPSSSPLTAAPTAGMREIKLPHIFVFIYLYYLYSCFEKIA